MKIPFSQIGIEIEYTDFNPRADPKFMDFLSLNGWIIAHDASVESPVYIYKDRPIYGELFDKHIRDQIICKGVIGGEFVSNIIDSDNPKWIVNIDNLFMYMKLLGEREETSRGSLHIHINYPRLAKGGFVLDQLLNPWILAGYLEAAFYRLGSFGYKARGEHMDFIYYRPITKSGPQVIYSGNRRYRHLLDYDSVLNSKNSDEFFFRCGDIAHAENRYHPCRYLWINFYNLYHKRKSHLEFRVFNKTLNWMYLYASVELCKHFVATCFKYKTSDLIKLIGDEKINSLDDPPENHENYFNKVLTLLDIKSDLVTSILYDIWQKSSWPDYSDSKVFSHLLNRVHVHRNSEFRPKELTDKEFYKVTAPYYVDIHYLKANNLTVFPENQPCAN